jgi:dTDP-4-dehydrorhamnose reductase
LAVTEVHLGCTREEQLRWLKTVWDGATVARERGADVRAVTAWAMLGSFDWDSLLTRELGHYEPGAYDVRGPKPRLTALGEAIGSLARSRPRWHPVTHGPGWWARKERFAHGHGTADPAGGGARLHAAGGVRPIVVAGAGGTLGTAIGRIAESRGLDARLLRRSALDVADPASVAAALAEHRPWAVVNAAGYVRVDEAERDADSCFRDNALGAEVLARECARRGAALVTFSSDLVFAGSARTPYVESDPLGPFTVYGASKLEAERRVAKAMPAALVVRTSAFFGPWDEHNMLTRALAAVRAGRDWEVPAAIVSPTYVPDLAHAVLDLLIDGERGFWHLANGGEVSWLEFIRRGVALAGLDPGRIRESSVLPGDARRPRYTALGSERGQLLPGLQDALARYSRECAPEPLRVAAPERFNAVSAEGA